MGPVEPKLVGVAEEGPEEGEYRPNMYLNHLDLVGLEYIDASCGSSPSSGRPAGSASRWDDESTRPNVLSEQLPQRKESREARRSSFHGANMKMKENHFAEKEENEVIEPLQYLEDDKVMAIENLTKWGFLR